MNKMPPHFSTPSRILDRQILGRLYQSLGRPTISLTLWDGYREGGQDPDLPGIVIHNRRTLWRLLRNPDLHFGEDYTRGYISLQGKLVDFLESIYRTGHLTLHNRRPWYRTSIGKAKQNAMHHYDIGNDFYQLWLDADMVYTCAYFPEDNVSLEQAQQAKLELICRKLQLKPGETVFEAGCGWGALALYMAKHYGVKVKAYNVSHAQIEEATRRANAAGLAGQVEFIEDDYRNLTGQCDVFVSIGMVEHVGPNNYSVLGQVIDRSLAVNGRGLIHNIAQNQPEPTNPWLQKYIFPGGYSPTLREMMDIFEPVNLSIVDLENLRLHYALTLRHWLQRFELHRGEVAAMYDANFVRMWRLYLCGSIANFTTGNLQLYQVLFQRPDSDILPHTRKHLYVEKY